MRRYRGYWFVANRDSTNVNKNRNLLARLRRNMGKQGLVVGYKYSPGDREGEPEWRWARSVEVQGGPGDPKGGSGRSRGGWGWSWARRRWFRGNGWTTDRGGVPRGSGATGDIQWQQNHEIIFADVLATWPKPHQKSPYKIVTNTRNCRHGPSSYPIDPKFKPHTPEH